MKYLKPINEIWGPVLKRDLLGETREEDKFHTKKELQEYLKSEIEKQGENVVIKNLDVSLIDDFSKLFKNIVYGVKTLDLSGWKTSNVKNMSKLFDYCEDLESVNLSGWDTSNVKDMTWMFYMCTHLKSINLSGWDTSNVENMSSIFFRCNSLESLDVSNWNTSSVVNMNGTFYGCNALKSLDLSGWDTSKVQSMTMMFFNCPAPYKIVGKKIVKK